MKYLIGILTLLVTACSTQPDSDVNPDIIPLDGPWEFATDHRDRGIEAKWYNRTLEDTITLPGTTDLRQKGFFNNDSSASHLHRIYTYEGPAWYRRKVIVPEHFRDKRIFLHLERTKSSRLWIDGRETGNSRLLQSPQRFEVTHMLDPGEHTLTLRIDNRLSLTPYGNAHIYSNDTQTNWNGILGEMFLLARDSLHIKHMRITPDITAGTANVLLILENPYPEDPLEVEIQVERTCKGRTKHLKKRRIKGLWKDSVLLEYFLDHQMRLWDEFSTPLYRLTATVSAPARGMKDTRTESFGMREFSAEGTQFHINGRPVFLRGKHEGAVFPLTGFAPMDVASWERVFRIAKEYGINHYRFHSYCPPRAAFIAADREGMYLQAELPFWGGLDNDSTALALREEGLSMLHEYGNHPSFVMFSHGNEIWSGHDRVEDNLNAFRSSDPRFLYGMGSNNNIGYAGPRECADFFIAARTPSAGDTTLTHTRLTHAFADSRDGGILNTREPSTDFDLSYPASQVAMPLVTHEIGQYQIYPNYCEIEKYTGVLRARNLEIFRARLEQAGMGHMDSLFQKASGAWSALCYKAEMEAALRTPGLAGFQLLDLQDFPGQGTALVGILDAFMDSKDVITAEDWRRSCDRVAVMARLPRFVWTEGEKLSAEVVVANYSAADLERNITWELQHNNEVLKTGAFGKVDMRTGEVTRSGILEIALPHSDQACKYSLELKIENTPYTNIYPIWVYPAYEEPADPGEVLVTESLDIATVSFLEKGGSVLYFPREADVASSSLPGLFPPDFWNYGMFRGISLGAGKPVSPGTLGLLMDPDHLLFGSFPTDFHSNWQWFHIVKAGRAMILDDYAGLEPLVWVIDNLERNHKLGLIYEMRYGQGKLLVCMSPLQKMKNRPEAGCLYRSILEYMNSAAFDPQYRCHTLPLP